MTLEQIAQLSIDAHRLRRSADSTYREVQAEKVGWHGWKDIDNQRAIKEVELATAIEQWEREHS